MLAAHEPEDLPLFRLIGAHEFSHNVYLFTDGPAHHASCWDARPPYCVWCHGVEDELHLGSWDSLTVAEKVVRLRGVAQECTPQGQTVPPAELAATVWASLWALQDADAEITAFTDGQFTTDQWERAKASPDGVSTLTLHRTCAGSRWAMRFQCTI